MAGIESLKAIFTTLPYIPISATYQRRSRLYLVTFGGYDQHCDPKELREERVHSEISYSSSLSDAASTQSRNLEAGIGIGHGKCYSLACFYGLLSFRNPGPPAQGWHHLK